MSSQTIQGWTTLPESTAFQRRLSLKLDAEDPLASSSAETSSMETEAGSGSSAEAGHSAALDSAEEEVSNVFLSYPSGKIETI